MVKLLSHWEAFSSVCPYSKINASGGLAVKMQGLKLQHPRSDSRRGHVFVVSQTFLSPSVPLVFCHSLFLRYPLTLSVFHMELAGGARGIYASVFASNSCPLHSGDTAAVLESQNYDLKPFKLLL